MVGLPLSLNESNIYDSMVQKLNMTSGYVLANMQGSSRLVGIDDCCLICVVIGFIHMINKSHLCNTTH